jgi:ribonuclease P protein component
MKFKLLVVVGKKLYKKANKRNRIRRKVVALFETLYSESRLPPYINCIIMVQHKDILYQTKKDLEMEILPKIKQLYLQMNSKPKVV